MRRTSRVARDLHDNPVRQHKSHPVMALSVRLPPQSVTNHERALDPAAWREWLSALPTTVSGSRLLLKHLRWLNRTLVAAAPRAELLEVIDPVVRTHAAFDHGHIRGLRLPLPASAERAFRIGQALLETLATAHLGLAVDAHADRVDDPLVARGVRAALDLRGEYLLRTTQVYTPVPAAFWHDVHAMYAWGEAAGVATQKIDDRTPVDAYNRLLLFAIGHGHGLPRNDADRTWRLLERWSLHADLTPLRETVDHSAFAVDLDAAEPPRQLKLMPADTRGDRRYLVVNGVIKAAAHLRGIREAGGRRGTLSRNALDRLLANWRQQAMRRSTRKPRGQRVDIEVSLQSIRQRLVADDTSAGAAAAGTGGADTGQSLSILGDADETRDPYAGFVSHPGRVVEVRRDDVWSRSIERKSDAYFRERSGVEAAGLVAAQRNPHQAWRLADLSPRGFGLEWVGRGNSHVTVGELIGLSIHSGGHAYMRIGVVRWLCHGEGGRLTLGAQALAEGALAGRLYRPARAGTQGAGEPALILGHDPRYPEPHQIILPAHLFTVHESLELDCDDTRFSVRLGALREETGSFALCGLEMTPKDNPQDDEGDDGVPEWEIL